MQKLSFNDKKKEGKKFPYIFCNNATQSLKITTGQEFPFGTELIMLFVLKVQSLHIIA